MLRARWMTRRDYAQVSTILESFSSDQTIADIRRKRTKNVLGKVAHEAGVVEGFMLYALRPDITKIRIVDFVVADKSRWNEVLNVLLKEVEGKLGQRYSHCEIDVSLDFASSFADWGFYAVAEEEDVVRMQMWRDARVPKFQKKHAKAAAK